MLWGQGATVHHRKVQLAFFQQAQQMLGVVDDQRQPVVRILKVLADAVLQIVVSDGLGCADAQILNGPAFQRMP